VIGPGDDGFVGHVSFAKMAGIVAAGWPGFKGESESLFNFLYAAGAAGCCAIAARWTRTMAMAGKMANSRAGSQYGSIIVPGLFLNAHIRGYINSPPGIASPG
jgi:hypothetical protein